MADRRKCPECGVSVKVENLPAHYEKQHPRAALPETLVEESTEATRAARREHRAPRPAGITATGKRTVLVVAIVVAVVLIIVIVNPFRPRGPQVGDAAPTFTVPNSDPTQGSIVLTSYRGSVTVLELMDVDCEVCVQEAPILASVYATYSPQGVRFLSVSLIDWVGGADTGGGSGTIATFKATHGTDWPYGMDVNRVVRDQYFPGTYGFGTPATYILDRNLTITAIIRGHAPGGAADYGAAIEAALGG